MGERWFLAAVLKNAGFKTVACGGALGLLGLGTGVKWAESDAGHCAALAADVLADDGQTCAAQGAFVAAGVGGFGINAHAQVKLA